MNELPDVGRIISVGASTGGNPPEKFRMKITYQDEEGQDHAILLDPSDLIFLRLKADQLLSCVLHDRDAEAAIDDVMIQKYGSSLSKFA